MILRLEGPLAAPGPGARLGVYLGCILRLGFKFWDGLV